MAIYMYRPEKIRKIPRKENHTEFWKLFNMLLTPFKKTQGLFFFGTDGVYHTISETTAKKFPLERKKKKRNSRTVAAPDDTHRHLFLLLFVKKRKTKFYFEPSFN